LVPEVYIETLNLYLGSKAQQYRLQNPSISSSSPQPDLSTSRQSIGFSPSEHDTLGKKLAVQQKWARSLSRQVDAHKASSDGFPDGQGRQYAVRPPRDGRRLKRQGPYLVQPEPRELPLSEEAGWGVEGVASDIVVVGDKSSTGQGTGPRIGMNVVGIAWVDGRVDLCVEAQKVEAEWETEDVSGQCREASIMCLLSPRATA
jgi:nucleoporin NUP82